MEKEYWRAVVGYEGLYEVSDQGKVRSLSWHQTSEIKELTIFTKRGYCFVRLSKNGVVKSIRIHRLVAMAFPEICGEYFEGAEINHINECKSDNRAINLEWCNRKYNVNYGTGQQRRVAKRSKAVVQYTIEGDYINTFTSAKDIERQLGYKNQTINNCCHGKQTAAYGYIWKFA